MSDLVLYNYFRSSTSYRARIALHHKGLEFEYKPVHLLNNGGEQNSDEYKRLNAELLVDNDKLRSENNSLFSSAVEECNAKINQLLNTNSDLIKEKAAAEEKLRLAIHYTFVSM